MSETKTYRGRSLEEVLPQIREELGPDALVLKRREGLTGGVGGFFQRPYVEVEARGPAVEEPVELRSDRATAEGLASPAMQALLAQASPFAARLAEAARRTRSASTARSPPRRSPLPGAGPRRDGRPPSRPTVFAAGDRARVIAPAAMVEPEVVEIEITEPEAELEPTPPRSTRPLRRRSSSPQADALRAGLEAAGLAERASPPRSSTRPSATASPSPRRARSSRSCAPPSPARIPVMAPIGRRPAHRRDRRRRRRRQVDGRRRLAAAYRAAGRSPSASSRRRPGAARAVRRADRHRRAGHRPARRRGHPRARQELSGLKAEVHLAIPATMSAPGRRAPGRRARAAQADARAAHARRRDRLPGRDHRARHHHRAAAVLRLRRRRRWSRPTAPTSPSACASEPRARPARRHPPAGRPELPARVDGVDAEGVHARAPVPPDAGLRHAGAWSST